MLLVPFNLVTSGITLADVFAHMTLYVKSLILCGSFYAVEIVRNLYVYWNDSMVKSVFNFRELTSVHGITQLCQHVLSLNSILRLFKIQFNFAKMY